MGRTKSSRGRRKPHNARSDNGPGTGRMTMTQQMPEGQMAEQPDQQFIIVALQEELNQAQQNRLYMLSMLRQKEAQLSQMAGQLSQLAGELERMRAEADVVQEAEAAVGPADMSGPTGGGN